jgi:integrase
MSVDIAKRTIKEYQSRRLGEKAAPKTINEEVGFLLRLLGDRGDAIRVRLRRQKALKLRVHNRVGEAFTAEEKSELLERAKRSRFPAIYPSLMLALHAGMRNDELRELQWSRVDLSKAFLTLGDSKSEAGEGRTIPLNSELLQTPGGVREVVHEAVPGHESRVVRLSEPSRQTGNGEEKTA